MIERQVLAALQEGPASGGALLERLHLDVRVYGALANLEKRGAVEIVGEGTGERVYGVPGTKPVAPRDPGLPASFTLTDDEIGAVDGRAALVTQRLPQHYFEEMRRALIAHSDRVGKLELDAFGEENPVRRFLRRVERGAPVRLRLRSSFRWVGGVLITLAVVALLRIFVIGVYTVPATSISMAPALFPAAEGGDALVLANLLAREPARGEVWIFRKGAQVFVKRVMGLPGERIEIDRGGDLIVNGDRLVKERALLDAVKVPLPGLDSVWPGYPLPDGSFERTGDLAVRDVVFSALVRARSQPASLMVKIGRFIVLLGPKGFASFGGVEFASGLDFGLGGGEIALWITNADGCLRVEVNGREIARKRMLKQQLESAEPLERVEVVRDGDIEVNDILLARDLRYGHVPDYTWTMKSNEVFVLGDNSESSYDSRQLGAIKTDLLLGRVWAVAWPLGRMRSIR